MDKASQEKLIDRLLVNLKDEIERQGATIKTRAFSFSEDKRNFLDDCFVSFEELKQVLNICLSRRYLKHMCSGGRYQNLILTEEGQGRAISVDMADIRPPSPSGGDIHIGTVNASGATQIGNNNTQSIENLFVSLVDQIENSSGTEEEKKEAKNRLRSFLEHPLVVKLLGAAATAALTSLAVG